MQPHRCGIIPSIICLTCCAPGWLGWLLAGRGRRPMMLPIRRPMGSSRALLLRLLPLVGALRLTTASGLVGRLAPLAAARPGYARTAAYPLLSPEVACCCAFGLYPAVVCGLRWWLAGSTHDTNAAWLRW
eukprot:COSAG01_NODE_1466_length_10220_cov_15.883608_5_plen_130_part_00